jgi:hypothetical protein
MAVGCQDGQGNLLVGRGKGRQLCVEAGDERGLGDGEGDAEPAPEQVTPDTMMGALLSSGKDSLSSLQKMKHSSITQLGKVEAAVNMAAAHLQTD